MSAAFLEKVRNLEAKCCQKAVLSVDKAGGDSISVGKEQKCDKMRTLFKDGKAKTGSERLLSGKRHQLKSNDLQKDRRSRIPKKKLPKRHLPNSKPQQTLSEKTFLTASIKSFGSARKAERLKMDFFDLTYSDNGLLGKKHSKEAQKTSKLPRKACNCNVREGKLAIN